VNRLDSDGRAFDPYDVLPRIKAGEVRVIRQSGMSSGDICLKRLGYDMDPSIPGGTGEARVVGTAYHAGQERYYRDRQDGVQATQAQIHESAGIAFAREAEGFTDWATTEGDAVKRVLSMLDAYFDDNCQWPNDYKVIAVEQEWFLPLCEGWAIKGSGDVVLEGPEGIVLEDHKTAGRKWPKGKESPRKQNQSPMYAYAWWACTGVMPAAFTFAVMTYKGEFERRWTYPKAEHMHAILDKARGLAAILGAVPGDLLPANPSSNLCSPQYCDHWARCAFGAELEIASLPPVPIQPVPA
jgi:hypothetical protein